MPARHAGQALITRVCGVAALVLLAHCTPPAALRVPLAPQPVAVDTVWYISARTRINGKDSRQLTDTLEYGQAIYRRDAMADAWTGRIRLTLLDSVSLSASAFETALRDRVNDARTSTVSDATSTVLYVHGFGTSLHESWQYTAEARVRAGATTPWVVFAWPSNGLGVSWPRSRAILTRAYHDDIAIAAQSTAAFVRATASVLRASPAEQTILLSHSLGGRIVSDAILNPNELAATLSGARFNAIAFVTPDVDATRFRDTVVFAAQSLTNRLLLYSSARDRVLAMARTIHDAPRAGLRTTPPLQQRALEAIDATEGLVAEGWLTSIFGTHHAIRRASAVLYDVSQLVGRNRAPDCRIELGTATRSPAGVWHLQKKRPPRPPLPLPCDRSP